MNRTDVLGAMVSVGVLLGGCGGDDAVSYSAPVGINLKAKGDDARAGVLTDEKNINTESGNPFGAFVSQARARLGRDPGRLQVQTADLRLGVSKGVTALDQVFAGRVDVLFVMTDSNNSFAVAHGDDPRGVGPVNLQVDFQPAMMLGGDFGKFLGGSFKVLLRGTAAPGFAGDKTKEADLQVTFGFAAFE